MKHFNYKNLFFGLALCSGISALIGITVAFVNGYCETFNPCMNFIYAAIMLEVGFGGVSIHSDNLNQKLNGTQEKLLKKVL